MGSISSLVTLKAKSPKCWMWVIAFARSAKKCRFQPKKWSKMINGMYHHEEKHVQQSQDLWKWKAELDEYSEIFLRGIHIRTSLAPKQSAPFGAKIRKAAQMNQSVTDCFMLVNSGWVYLKDTSRLVGKQVLSSWWTSTYASGLYTMFWVIGTRNSWQHRHLGATKDCLKTRSSTEFDGQVPRNKR